MSWRDEAACRGVDPELFFPTAEAGEVFEAQVAAAKAVCAQCTVRAVCLAEALERLPYGVVGGLSEDERRALRQRAPATVPQPASGSVRAVAREHGVSERTAQRWAARHRAEQNEQANQQVERAGSPAVAS